MKKKPIFHIEQSPDTAELEVNYKYKQKPVNLPRLTTSWQCAEVLRSVWSDKIDFIEEFVMLLLNRSNKLLGYVKIAQGGTTSITIDAKIVFAVALRFNASSIIISHNHPSQEKSPSGQDIELTKHIKKGGKLLGITLLDHLIITSEDYYSFADEGLILKKTNKHEQQISGTKTRTQGSKNTKQRISCGIRGIGLAG